MSTMTWAQLTAQGGAIEGSLRGGGYYSAAIYGFGVYGYILYEELKQKGFEVSFVIDQAKSRGMLADIPVYDLNDDIPACDIVIVSLIDGLPNIFKFLSDRIHCPVLSMYEAVEGATGAKFLSQNSH